MEAGTPSKTGKLSSGERWPIDKQQTRKLTIMKKPNITPGPWKVGINPGEVHWAENGRKRIVDNSHWIGESSRLLYPEEERNANAQAIAALPDLLAALELLLTSELPTDSFLARIEKGKRMQAHEALIKAGYTF